MTNSDDLIEGLMDNLRPGPLCLDLTFTPSQDRQLNIVMLVNTIRFLKKKSPCQILKWFVVTRLDTFSFICPFIFFKPSVEKLLIKKQ